MDLKEIVTGLSYITGITYQQMINLENPVQGTVYKCEDVELNFVYIKDEGFILIHRPILDISILDSEQKTVYIIGNRTSGIDYINTFNKYELILKYMFKNVINPVEIYESNKNRCNVYICNLYRDSLKKSDCVYLIDGWKECIHAKQELKMAIDLGLEII